MAANCFSRINMASLERSNYMRVWHSFTNFFGGSERSDLEASTTTGVGNAVGIAGMGLGVAALSSTATALAIAGAATGIGGAVIALGLFAYSAYSNRDAKHRDLQPYVWSLVDDTPPKGFSSPQELNEAAKAAGYLIVEGKNQINDFVSKIKEASELFDQFTHNVDFRIAIINNLRIQPQFIQGDAAIHDQVKSLLNSLKEEWDEAIKENGPVFEWLRRCHHAANYLQAPHIMSLAMKEKVSPGSVVKQAQNDYFAGVPFAMQTRQNFAKYDKLYQDNRTGPYYTPPPPIPPRPHRQPPPIPPRAHPAAVQPPPIPPRARPAAVQPPPIPPRPNRVAAVPPPIPPRPRRP